MTNQLDEDPIENIDERDAMVLKKPNHSKIIILVGLGMTLMFFIIGFNMDREFWKWYERLLILPGSVMVVFLGCYLKDITSFDLIMFRSESIELWKEQPQRRLRKLDLRTYSEIVVKYKIDKDGTADVFKIDLRQKTRKRKTVIDLYDFVPIPEYKRIATQIAEFYQDNPNVIVNMGDETAF